MVIVLLDDRLVVAHAIVLVDHGRVLGFDTAATGTPAIAAAVIAKMSLRRVFSSERVASATQCIGGPAFAQRVRNETARGAFANFGTQACALRACASASTCSRSANCLSCHDCASAAAFAQVGV